MENVVMRVWVPDRPGALGAVASRIGAVRGDLIGIDILERGGGRAIDELVVSLPDAGLVDLLVLEVSQVDGVDVEEVRPAPESVHDPRLDALETAAILVEHTRVEALIDSLVFHAKNDFDADWSVAVGLSGPVPVTNASVGDSPGSAWLGAFVAGSRSSELASGGQCGPDDIAWAQLSVAEMALVLGRAGRPFRARERRQLAALARIADCRWAELVARSCRELHPVSVARAHPSDLSTARFQDP